MGAFIVCFENLAYISCLSEEHTRYTNSERDQRENVVQPGYHESAVYYLVLLHWCNRQTYNRRRMSGSKCQVHMWEKPSEICWSYVTLVSDLECLWEILWDHTDNSEFPQAIWSGKPQKVFDEASIDDLSCCSKQSQASCSHGWWGFWHWTDSILNNDFHLIFRMLVGYKAGLHEGRSWGQAKAQQLTLALFKDKNVQAAKQVKVALCPCSAKDVIDLIAEYAVESKIYNRQRSLWSCRELYIASLPHEKFCQFFLMKFNSWS